MFTEITLEKGVGGRGRFAVPLLCSSSQLQALAPFLGRVPVAVGRGDFKELDAAVGNLATHPSWPLMSWS